MPGDYLNDNDKGNGDYDEDREAAREFDDDGADVGQDYCESCGRRILAGCCMCREE